MKDNIKFPVIFLVIYVLSFSPAFGEDDHTINNNVKNNCAPPYEPDNIFTVIFNYSKGMDYISTAESTCSNNFAEELVETFRDSFWVSQGCLDVTIEDVEEAKAKRSPPLA
jgi:hypothetical protein